MDQITVLDALIKNGENGVVSAKWQTREIQVFVYPKETKKRKEKGKEGRREEKKKRKKREK